MEVSGLSKVNESQISGQKTKWGRLREPDKTGEITERKRAGKQPCKVMRCADTGLTLNSIPKMLRVEL